MMSKDMIKFVELEKFICSNYDKLSDEQYEYLWSILEQLIQIIHYRR